ncbi:MAG: APC family permease [Firmicutes bacterium]|nr:APC family permease [Bacillota bacterium]
MATVAKGSEAGAAPAQLRREVSVWGSYMWGFSDVGADIFAGLGLVTVASQGAAPAAFALAGLVYVLIGLAYTELAAAFPVAGGGQYFATRGLGDLWGLITGGALILDYTIDIALFAVSSTGYLNALIAFFSGVDLTSIKVPLLGLHVQAVWLLEALALIAALMWINVRGMRESNMFNQMVGLATMVIDLLLLLLGFVTVWSPGLFGSQVAHQMPSLHQFMYGSSLAIISFVGLESISQAAQETRHPSRILPRSTLTLILTIFITSIGYSVLANGTLPWNAFAGHEQDSVTLLARRMPFIGPIAGPLTAVMGAAILAISANSGVMSVSRLTYSMSHHNLLSSWFDYVDPRRFTPVRTILFFSGIGLVWTLFAFATPSVMDTLGNMYAFGATLGYVVVFMALIALRRKEPEVPRPFLMPLNLRLRNRDGRPYLFPVLGAVGFVSVLVVLFEVLYTHAVGRIFGPIWVVGWLVYFVYYRRRSGLGLRTLPRDWVGEQKEILASAEEYQLLAEYEQAVAASGPHLERAEGFQP